MTNPNMGDVSSDDKLWAALTYVFSPLVPLIIMFAMPDKKERPFIKAHNMQALILGILAVILYPVCGLGFLILIYQLYCAFQSYNGNVVEIPGLTNFIKTQGWA